MKSRKLLTILAAFTSCLAITLSGCGKSPAPAASAAVSDANTSGKETSDAASEANANASSAAESQSAASGVNANASSAAESQPAASESNANTSSAAQSQPAASAAGSSAIDPAVAAVPSVNAPFTDPLEALSNDAIPWGYADNDRDAANRPNGSLYFQRLYGSYADFIGLNTKTIYLTMDEGYEAGYTPTILDTLKAKNVKATFFITKQFFDSDPELVQRMIDEGHTIGNHTCAHPAGGIQQLGTDGQKEDIMRLHNLVKDAFNYDMTLFRYPEGVFSKQSLVVLNQLGYRPIFWSFAHADWNQEKQPDPAASLQKCVSSVHPGAIYLLHAVSATNTAILGDFIDQVRAQGYEFGTIPSTGFAG